MGKECLKEVKNNEYLAQEKLLVSVAITAYNAAPFIG